MTTAEESPRPTASGPTLAEVVEAAAREGTPLGPEDAESLHDITVGLIATIHRLEALCPDEAQGPAGTRDPGRRPTPDEDPFNAFIWMCDIPGAGSGPLAGISVAVKDNIDVAGIPTTNGSAMTPHIPGRDAIVIERILAAGGRLTGKLNMDNFSAASTGETSAFGPTLNPRDRTRSPGGSSSGSGAVVASGALDMTLGADSGGSARIPASFCGIVAIKPTHGLVPSLGVTHLDHTMDGICPITRSVADAALLLNVIGGPDPRDPQWVRGEVTTHDYVDAISHVSDLAGKKVGVISEGMPEQLVQAAVREAVGDASATFRDAGATIDTISVPLWDEAGAIAQGLICHFTAVMLRSEGAGYGHMGAIDPERLEAFARTRRSEYVHFPPYVRACFLVEQLLHEHDLNVPYAKLHKLRLLLAANLARAFTEYDLLLVPTTPTTAFPLLESDSDPAIQSRRIAAASFNTAGLNLSGNPAVAVPGREDADGLPTSLQVIARHHDDRLALQAAAILEAASPG